MPCRTSWSACRMKRTTDVTIAWAWEAARATALMAITYLGRRGRLIGHYRSNCHDPQRATFSPRDTISQPADRQWNAHGKSRTKTVRISPWGGHRLRNDRRLTARRRARRCTRMLLAYALGSTTTKRHKCPSRTCCIEPAIATIVAPCAVARSKPFCDSSGAAATAAAAGAWHIHATPANKSFSVRLPDPRQCATVAHP